MAGAAGGQGPERMPSDRPYTAAASSPPLAAAQAALRPGSPRPGTLPPGTRPWDDAAECNARSAAARLRVSGYVYQTCHGTNHEPPASLIPGLGVVVTQGHNRPGSGHGVSPPSVRRPFRPFACPLTCDPVPQPSALPVRTPCPSIFKFAASGGTWRQW